MRVFHGQLQLLQRHVFPVLENKVSGKEEFVLPLPHDLDEVILGVERASGRERRGDGRRIRVDTHLVEDRWVLGGDQQGDYSLQIRHPVRIQVPKDVVSL